jgi:drug/metabolite transporter (DMT)-like permease
MLRWWLVGSLVSGVLLFVGMTFQQYGLLWTSAGKAGFITSLYVVLVPLILRLSGQKILLGEGLGAVLAVIGLYFLSFTPGSLSLAPGDSLVLGGAFIWAGHVIALSWLSPKMDSIMLGTGQALVCGILGLLATVLKSEWPSWDAVLNARLELFWGSILSVALGFTLQVVGQKAAKPAPAAIIMQMEAVVAAIAGGLVLHEVMSGRMLAGALLMFAGMMISQLWGILSTGKSV